MLRQRKVPKRKANPTACPQFELQARFAALPCASRNFERSPNSQDLPRLRLANPARQAGSLDLKIPAMLGSAHGTWVSYFSPVGAAEERREKVRPLFTGIAQASFSAGSRPHLLPASRDDGQDVRVSRSTGMCESDRTYIPVGKKKPRHKGGAFQVTTG